jgi:hypothetical protein
MVVDGTTTCIGRWLVVFFMVSGRQRGLVQVLGAIFMRLGWVLVPGGGGGVGYN